MNSHKHARLTAKGRGLLVNRVLKEGWTVKEASEAVGVSERTGYKWLARFRTEGDAGLSDRSSRPRRCPHAVSPEDKQRWESLRRQRWSQWRIAVETGGSLASVSRHLRRIGLSRLKSLDAVEPVVRYERAAPGELLHLDTKKLGRIPDGGGWRYLGRAQGNRHRHRHSPGKNPAVGTAFVHTALDDHSRVAYAEIHNDETAAKLKAWYRQLCKRPCFHDEYLDAFNRPNVTLVDTKGRGVDRITEKGVVFDGKEYEVDCIIFATGFEVGTAYTRRSGYDLIGRGGIRLSQKWANGASTLHGMFSRDFPNCFFMGTMQSGFTANFPHALDYNANHLTYVIKSLRESNHTVVEPTAEAEAEWVETIIREARMGMRFYAECTPGYYNNEGKPNERSRKDGFYGAGPVAYFQLLKKWRDSGDMPGMEIT